MEHGTNLREIEQSQDEEFEEIITTFKNKLKSLNILYDEQKEEGFHEFFHNLTEEERRRIDYETFWKSLFYQLEKVWDHLSAQPYELIPLFVTINFIKETNDMSQIGRLFETLQLKLTPKDKKKGINGAIQRLKKNYYKPQVRESLKNLTAVFMKEPTQKVRDGEDAVTTIKEIVEEYGFFGAWYPIMVILKDENDWGALLKEACPVDYFCSLVELYEFYKTYQYDALLKGTVQSTVTMKTIQKEKKQMTLKMSKKEKEASRLKKTVFELNQENKQLQGQIYELYDESLKEIDYLKTEMEAEREAFLKIIEYQNETIMDLIDSKVQDQEESRNQPIKIDFDLQGKTVAVVGGDKIRHIRDVVNKYNGILEFVSEKDISLVEGTVSRADVVFFMKEFAGHHLFRKALSSADKYHIPFKYVNTTGVTGFERALKEYIVSSNLNY